MRMACGNEPTRWARLLPDVEFRISDAASEATGQTPFFINFGFHPRSVSDSLVGAPEGRVQRVEDHTSRLKKIHRAAIEGIIRTNARTKSQADKRRRDESFQPGEVVWVDAKAVRLRGNPKLNPRFVGPFKILIQYSPVSYRLELPEQYKRVYPVFHVSKLKRWRSREEPPSSLVQSKSLSTRFRLSAPSGGRRIDTVECSTPSF